MSGVKNEGGRKTKKGERRRKMKGEGGWGTTGDERRGRMVRRGGDSRRGREYLGCAKGIGRAISVSQRGK
jgi:hypothetical protein